MSVDLMSESVRTWLLHLRGGKLRAKLARRLMRSIYKSWSKDFERQTGQHRNDMPLDYVMLLTDRSLGFLTEREMVDLQNLIAWSLGG